MKEESSYLDIVHHYESCFERHGDTHLGVDWPKPEDAAKRYDVMLDLLYFNKEQQTSTLLDFGCGTAHLLEHLLKKKPEIRVQYSGLDLSDKFVAACREKFPDTAFYCMDVLRSTEGFPQGIDYMVLNGVFTEKRSLDYATMFIYFKNMVRLLYPLMRKGMAFNVMSKQVDWERDDLFHLPFDELSNFLCREISRNFILRNDYGLYEYTVYLYK